MRQAEAQSVSAPSWHGAWQRRGKMINSRA